MKDLHDSQTKELFMADENVKTYRVNYGYAIKGKLRAGALILQAKDLKTVKEMAVKQLSDEYDWHQLNSIKEV